MRNIINNWRMNSIYSGQPSR